MDRRTSPICYHFPSGKYSLRKARMSELFTVEIFENSRGSFTVLKINNITKTATDIETFADKKSAIAFAIENGYKMKDLGKEIK
jgi:hypothetical protein